MRRTPLRHALVALCAVTLASLPILSARASSTTTVFSMTFNEYGLGSTVSYPDITGTAQPTVFVSVVPKPSRAKAAENGTTSTNRSMDLRGASASIPAIVGLKSSGSDALAVGSGSFTWRADFSFDTTIGGGENILQRGLAGGPQWKLSADDGRVLCALRLSEGAAALTTPAVTIAAGNTKWHRGECRRDASAGTLTSTVSRWDTAVGGFVVIGSHTVSGAGGDLRFDVDTQVTIGGKLSADGSPHPSPDQFDGRIDNVSLRLG